MKWIWFFISLLFFISCIQDELDKKTRIAQLKLLLEIETGAKNLSKLFPPPTVSIPTTTTTQTPSTSPTPYTPPSPNISSTQTVQGKGDWQVVNGNIQGNVQINITASGSWAMTSLFPTYFGPEGTTTNPSFLGDYRYNTSYNYGQLICRFSAQSGILFSLGITNINGNGTVDCRMNDSDTSNNTGSITVNVVVTVL